MNGKLLSPIAVILVLFLVPRSMSAHHGTSAYDVTKVVTLKGVVTNFDFINPHSEIRVAVTDNNGHTENWLCEAGSLNFLIRRGWNRNSLKPGDVITIMGNAVKSGATNLRLTKVVLADGKELDPIGTSQNGR
jgi:uncharacterized protein DUF6152